MPRANRKRRRSPAPEMHRNNKYKESPPDFSLLASLYPSFRPYLLFPSSSDRPTIDFTAFSATRELTRVLLLHDHGVNWWIPDGQLCPTVPNRSNYIHWIGDLLSSNLIPPISHSDSNSKKPVRGFDIGTGANCIYPLLGASLMGWSFVGSDVTEVGLEWARKNVESNPHISNLIEIRDARKSRSLDGDEFASKTMPSDHVLVGVVKEGESFDFCMCNPPFFESLEDAGLNPKTSCGGTSEEMVCPGGEQAFIRRIIEDSVSLKHSFRWFTSMVGRKVNLKILISKIREAGATVVKTTEFVQGQTARWGLAWSFIPPRRSLISPNAPIKTDLSFMLQGLRRKAGAFQVLNSVETFFLSAGASCKSDLASFSVNITISDEQAGEMFNDGTKTDSSIDGLSFRITVFEQTPGTLLVKGSLLRKDSSNAGAFRLLFLELEENLKVEFLHKPGG